jgi:hypothetical protein
MIYFGKDINGWNVAAVFGDRAFYHGDWLARAGSAKWGIFGNSEQEALYPFVTKEPNERRLAQASIITHSHLQRTSSLQ